MRLGERDLRLMLMVLLDSRRVERMVEKLVDLFMRDDIFFFFMRRYSKYFCRFLVIL